MNLSIDKINDSELKDIKRIALLSGDFHEHIKQMIGFTPLVSDEVFSGLGDYEIFSCSVRFVARFGIAIPIEFLPAEFIEIYSSGVEYLSIILQALDIPETAIIWRSDTEFGGSLSYELTDDLNKKLGSFVNFEDADMARGLWKKIGVNSNINRKVTQNSSQHEK